MGKQRCLIIADDLTGGADTGVQFAKQGLKTLLIPFTGEGLNPFAGRLEEALVVTTGSRGLSPAKAFDTLSALLDGFDSGRFPILYKKIDSTLRGNIGSEIEAILEKTGLPLCFLAPSYPEQGRTLVGGSLMVGGKPLALTEAARDAASPVRESDVRKLLAGQTGLSIGTIALADVASGRDALREAVRQEQRAGRRIIVFDAAARGELATIAEVAFSMERVPLLAGSAGLAGEVAKLLVPGTVRTDRETKRSFRHTLTVAGSASAVTHAQLQRLAERGIPSFQLPMHFVFGRGTAGAEERREFVCSLGRTLANGSAILRTSAERWTGDGGAAIPERITAAIADAAVRALRQAGVRANDLALILTGGDTALGVLQLLSYEGIELEGELLAGIVQGNLRGGPWDGLAIVTKAGGFGKEDALLKIQEMLDRKGTSARRDPVSRIPVSRAKEDER